MCVSECVCLFVYIVKVVLLANCSDFPQGLMYKKKFEWRNRKKKRQLMHFTNLLIFSSFYFGKENNNESLKVKMVWSFLFSAHER